MCSDIDRCCLIGQSALLWHLLRKFSLLRRLSCVVIRCTESWLIVVTEVLRCLLEGDDWLGTLDVSLLDGGLLLLLLLLLWVENILWYPL